jgi:cysteine desulfurase/selenocysteine lyase
MSGAYDLSRVREDFPILRQKIRGKPLVYLDNAATTQKPASVLQALHDYYAGTNANIHRGVHTLSQRATDAYEAAREKVRRFVNARETREIVFVRGATEGINLVAQTLGRRSVGAGDEILITAMEHHSNIVPWQLLAEEKGARLRVAPITDAGELDFGAWEKLLGPRTRIAAFPHVSNALGTVNPVGRMIEAARARGIATLVDGAQAAPHAAVDVQRLGCDFYVLSGHKLYGPTGIGVLYGRAEALEKLPPWQGGGDMILSVTFERTEYNELPYRFEAGTPDIAGVIGLGAAIDYLGALGMDRIARHEAALLARATEAVAAIEGVRLVGTAREKAGVLSFTLDGIHPHDIGTILDDEGVAIRTGHHCAQPVMDRFGVPATARASFGLYNTTDEIDALVSALRRVKEVFHA